MGFKFNALTGQFDLAGSGGGGSATFKAPVATEAALPLVGNADGDARVTLDTDYIWFWDNSTSRWINGGIKSATVGATPTGAGYSLDYVNVAANRREYRLTLQPANGTNPGVVTTGSQTFAGAKTFDSITVPQINGDTEFTGAVELSALTANAPLVLDASNEVASLPLTNGQLIVGSTGAAPVAATLTGTANRVTVTNGAGTVTLSGPQDIATTSSPTFANVTATDTLFTTNGIDVVNSGGSDTLSIGTNNAEIINIGGASGVVNINGTVNNNTVTNLNVTDKLITINDGGGAGSGSGSGFEIEEDGSPTGHIKTSGDRASYVLKAPATASEVTITPGASGFTLNGTEVKGPATATDEAIARYDGTTGKLVQDSVVTISNTGDVNGVNDLFVGNDLSITNDLAVTNDVGVGGDLEVTGQTTLDTALTGVLKATAGVVSAADVILTSEVTGVLPVANGGTNSSAVLNNNRIMTSVGGAIVEAAALTNGQLLIGSTGAAPVAAAITAGANISVTNGAGSITIAAVPFTGDIVPTSFTALDNQASPQDITGFVFAASTGFDAMVNIVRDTTYSTYKLLGVEKGGSWEMSQESVGDDTGLVFSITSAGQIQYTSSSTGQDADLRFRASAL